MGSFRALLMAGAVVTGAASVARAADLPPPPQLEPTLAPVAAYDGWYLRADVGVNNAILDDFTSNASQAPRRVPGFKIEQSNLGDSVSGGGGVGYQFNSFLRFDLTGEYRTSQEFEAVESYSIRGANSVVGRGFDHYHGSFQNSVFLANAYLDFGHWCGFTPYAGGGAGFAYNRVGSLNDTGVGSTAPGGQGNGGFGFIHQATATTSFAWAATAGISYDITPNVKLDVSYRYLNMGDANSGRIGCTTRSSFCEKQKYSLAANDFRIGLRWMFNTVGPAVPVGPVAPYPVAYDPPPAPAPVYRTVSPAPGPVVRRY